MLLHSSFVCENIPGNKTVSDSDSDSDGTEEEGFDTHTILFRRTTIIVFFL